MKKIPLLFLNLPEDLQFNLLHTLEKHFPTVNFNVNNEDAKQSPQIIFALYKKDDKSLLQKFPRTPLFLFIDSELTKNSHIFEISRNRPLFDYCFLNDPPDRIEKRIIIFLNSFLTQNFTQETPKKPSKAGIKTRIFEKTCSFLSRVFRPRNHVISPEMMPVIGNRWEKIRRLGFGSFGEVWLVRRVGTVSDNYAVAKIPHDYHMNPKFLQEADILNRLSKHPNSVKLIEILEQAGKVVLIEEYIDGRTLQELIDEGMEPKEKEQLFLQILDMIAYAHDHLVMHRDLKPENILVTHDRLVKVLDFGTAKDVSDKSVSSTVVGSRPYMAPEQIMGKSRLASDVWALGVLLYALATDYLPFYSEREKELMDLILETEPQKPSELIDGISPELERIIMKCLEKDPTRRYPTARKFQEDLLKTLPDFGKGTVIPV